MENLHQNKGKHTLEQKYPINTLSRRLNQGDSEKSQSVMIDGPFKKRFGCLNFLSADVG